MARRVVWVSVEGEVMALKVRRGGSREERSCGRECRQDNK